MVKSEKFIKKTLRRLKCKVNLIRTEWDKFVVKSLNKKEKEDDKKAKVKFDKNMATIN